MPADYENLHGLSKHPRTDSGRWQDIELGMGWADSQRSSAGPAQLIFDNLEVRLYESPQLTIQNTSPSGHPGFVAAHLWSIRPGKRAKCERPTGPGPRLLVGNQSRAKRGKRAGFGQDAVLPGTLGALRGWDARLVSGPRHSASVL